MLTLARDCSQPTGECQDADKKPAKYVVLKRKETSSFGRGMKNNFKFFHPWVSRKHFTICEVHRGHFLEAFGQMGVFVNDVKVDCKVLEDGDIITFGGCVEPHQNAGLQFPAQPSPSISYVYREKIDFFDDPDSAYSENIRPEDIISLEERNFLGKLVQETYHIEDFNASQMDIKYTGPSLLPLIPDKKSKKKSRSCWSSKTSETFNEKSLEDSSVPIPVKPPKVPRTSKRESSMNKVPKTKNISRKSSPSAALGCPKQDDDLIQSSAPVVPGPSGIADLNVDDSRQSETSQGKLKDIDEELSGLITSIMQGDTEKNFQQKIDKLQESVHIVRDKIKFYMSLVRAELESSSEQLTSEVGTCHTSRTNAKTGDDVNNNLKIKKEKAMACTSTSSVAFNMPQRVSKRTRCKKIIYLSEDEEEDPISPVKKRRKSTMESQAAAIPDLYVPPGEKQPKKDAFSKLTGQQLKKKGKQKTLTQPSVVHDAAKTALIKAWQRPPIPKPTSKLVSVIKDKGPTFSYIFEDTNIFQLTIEKRGMSTDTNKYSSYYEGEYELKVDLPLLEYALIHDTLSKDDKTRFYKVIMHGVPKIGMADFKLPEMPAVDPVKQPEEINIELKGYQLSTIAWMINVEQSKDEGWTISKLVPWKKANTIMQFDIGENVAYLPPIPVCPRTSYKVHIKGGILADEMGLGKTITLLGLLASNRPDFPRIPAFDTFQEKKTPYFPCHATLVVVPSHLTAQWKCEVETHTSGFKVILITTKTQFDKLSYLDVLEADIVVVSVQFVLTNKVYNTKPTGMAAEHEFITLLNKPGINPLLMTNPNFCHFEWWRLVSDEAHELLTYETDRKGHEKASSGLSVLSAIPAKHRWYMTGTPFPHAERSLKAAMRFLHMTVDDAKLMNPDGSVKLDHPLQFAGDDLNVQPIYSLIRKKFYVRNTKQSIGVEYDVPQYVEELMLLAMSPVERGIYDRAYGERSRRQVCCHLQLDNQVGSIVGTQQKTLEEVKNTMILHTRKQLETQEKYMEQNNENLRKTRIELAEETEAHKRRILQARIDRGKTDIKYYEEQIKKHESSISYFDSIIPRITHSAEEPCVICLDNIERLTVTPCGHLFCRTCIMSCIERQRMCPTCRQAVEPSQLVEVKDKVERDNLKKKAELERLTERFGTKMAYLIFYLRYLFRDQKESRVIIFSQWDSMLHKIGNTLQENGITNVFVKGNVHCRNKAITSFRKQEKVRVIMLSLENAASGTNLVEASHVILIDPVAGTKEQATAVESQAIGRAHRMGQDKQIVVARMIVRDTIEHELYLRNNDEAIQQVEFEFDQEGATNASSSTLEGVQIVRTVRKVPAPADTAMVSRAISASSSVRDGPDPDAHRPTFTDSWMYQDPMDYMDYESDYYGDRYSGEDSYSEDENEHCTLQ